jgi:hypothetical protein
LEQLKRVDFAAYETTAVKAWSELQRSHTPVLPLETPTTQEPPSWRQEPPDVRLPQKPQIEELRKWRPKDVKDWFEETIKNHPQKRGESKNAWARRLYNDHMTKDFGEDIPWTSWETLRRRMDD